MFLFTNGLNRGDRIYVARPIKNVSLGSLFSFFSKPRLLRPEWQATPFIHWPNHPGASDERHTRAADFAG
jgi:hypothetical protein